MKTSSSKLFPLEGEILRYREAGFSYRKIAEKLTQEHSIKISYNGVFKFLQSLEKQNNLGILFHENLPEDIRVALLKQIAALWTYDSTGIEGNTLTLGETVKVLELGLTISGKPLKDHEEVYGHAKAIDLIYELIGKDKIEREDLFNLHRCVMQKSPIDYLRPIGDWKRDYNGTTGVSNEKPIYMEYASPSETPKLMTRWIKEFNRKLNTATSATKAINVYAWAHLSFVRIHPFFDGNGRIARLIANLPLLKCGQVPLMISQERRSEYIDLLWNYQTAVGILTTHDRLLPPHKSIDPFKNLLREEWKETYQLVDKAKTQASGRQKP